MKIRYKIKKIPSLSLLAYVPIIFNEENKLEEWVKFVEIMKLTNLKWNSDENICKDTFRYVQLGVYVSTTKDSRKYALLSFSNLENLENLIEAKVKNPITVYEIKNLGNDA